MQNIILMSFLVLFFASCKGQDNSLINISRHDDTSTTFRKEIPIYKDGRRKGETEYLFKSIRQDATELSLDFIENGFDTLQIRVWLGHSLAVQRNVVVLKKIKGQWFGQLFTYSYGYKGKDQKEFVTNKKIKDVIPKSGWNDFVKQVMKLQILTLPNGKDIKDYNSCGGLDGIDYFFEIASPKEYRFYYYCNPTENANLYWQVKNVLEFSHVLESELDFIYTR